jgi:hypothetical protein
MPQPEKYKIFQLIWREKNNHLLLSTQRDYSLELAVEGFEFRG